MKNGVFNSVKKAWFKGVEAVGNTASGMAQNAKFKLNEMSMENQRREILSNFGLNAYELWKRGVQFPQELEDQLVKLEKIDVELSELRAQKYAAELQKAASSKETKENSENPDNQQDEHEIQESWNACEEDAQEQETDDASCEVPYDTDNTSENETDTDK